MPTARSGLGLAAASNGKVYAVGGINASTDPIGDNRHVLPTTEEYDPATDTWASKAPMPTARIISGLAAASNGKLYAIGGLTQVFPAGHTPPVFLQTVEEYDPQTDNWTTKTPMPTARNAPVAMATNGRLYVVGGDGGGPDFTATVEEYDPATDKWVTKRPLPAARGGLALAAASNGKLYAVGGGFAGHADGKVEEYDPATDTWTTKASMPTARSELGLVAASDGKLYAIGGGGGSKDTVLPTVEAYDPTTNGWVPITPLSTPRHEFGVAAASNGKLYAIGGESDSDPIVPMVEEYTP
jgi:N-acetylneuraminic acid mutarotase